MSIATTTLDRTAVADANCQQEANQKRSRYLIWAVTSARWPMRTLTTSGPALTASPTCGVASWAFGPGDCRLLPRANDARYAAIDAFTSRPIAKPSTVRHRGSLGELKIH